MKLIHIQQIHRDTQHNGLTDLAHWRDQYWIAFRNGHNHTSYDGKIHIYSSPDTHTWQQTATINAQADLRDPKFVSLPDKLILNICARKQRRGQPTRLYTTQSTTREFSSESSTRLKFWAPCPV